MWDSHSSFQKTRGFQNDSLCKLEVINFSEKHSASIFRVQEPWTPVTIISYNTMISQKTNDFISEKLAASTIVRLIKRCYIPGD